MKKFDLKTVYHSKRPLSWSAISSFGWAPSQWYSRYVLKEDNPTSPEMTFGKEVGERLASDPKYLTGVPRLPVFEHELRATFNGIPLIGYVDSYCPKILHLLEYKTGRKPWDQKRADEHGQVDMYLFMLYLRDKIKPESVTCRIVWLPTHIEDGKVAFIKEGDVRIFETKRSMRQILAFGQRIKDNYQAMEEYASRQAEYHSNSLTDW